VCIALCTIVAHNIAQNRPDNFPPYPPDNHHCSDDVYLREGGGERPRDAEDSRLACHLEIGVKGHSRSAEMLPMTTVNISCTSAFHTDWVCMSIPYTVKATTQCVYYYLSSVQTVSHNTDVDSSVIHNQTLYLEGMLLGHLCSSLFTYL